MEVSSCSMSLKKLTKMVLSEGGYSVVFSLKREWLFMKIVAKEKNYIFFYTFFFSFFLFLFFISLLFFFFSFFFLFFFIIFLFFWQCVEVLMHLLGHVSYVNCESCIVMDVLRWYVWFWCCDNCYLHGQYKWICIVGGGGTVEGMK